jgi:NAD(P)-dependent dehydrogenase (short-subunit alcohol dehydrogenase family)
MVVISARFIRPAEAGDYGDQDWNLVLQVNLNSVGTLCREAGRGFMNRCHGGKIIDVPRGLRVFPRRAIGSAVGIGGFGGAIGGWCMAWPVSYLLR